MVHPTRDNIEHVPVSRAVRYGLNAEVAPLRDDRFRRCVQCGHMCHLDRDLKAPDGARTGDGRSADDDATVTSGCPFCGSLRWAR